MYVTMDETAENPQNFMIARALGRVLNEWNKILNLESSKLFQCAFHVSKTSWMFWIKQICFNSRWLGEYIQLTSPWQA